MPGTILKSINSIYGLRENEDRQDNIDIGHGNRLTAVETTNTTQDAVDVQHGTRLGGIETVNTTQDGGLTALEAPVWNSLRSTMYFKTTGGTSPAYGNFNNGIIQKPFFTAGRVMYEEFTTDSSFVGGQNVYLRLSFGHNGTNITGNLVLRHTVSVAAANGVYITEFAFNITIPVTLVVAPRFGNKLVDILIATATPNASQFNSNLITDGSNICVTTSVTTLPTITAPLVAGVFFNNSVLRQYV